MFDRERNTDLKSFDIKTDSQNDSYNDDNDNHEKKRKFFLPIIIFSIVICLSFIYYFWQKTEKNIEVKESKNLVMFIPLDEITVNLRNSSDSNGAWLRIKISLEVNGKTHYDIVSKMIPKIYDIFQTYLKELRKNDLDGSFGIYKIKDEMMMRINAILYPAKIENILFQEFLIQTL